VIALSASELFRDTFTTFGTGQRPRTMDSCLNDRSSGYDNDDDDLDDFLDANTFSFGSLKSTDMLACDDAAVFLPKAARAVRFNTLVDVFDGAVDQVPIAEGDGFWDTLREERSSGLYFEKQESNMSLSVAELDADGSVNTNNVSLKSDASLSLTAALENGGSVNDTAAFDSTNHVIQFVQRRNSADDLLDSITDDVQTMVMEQSKRLPSRRVVSSLTRPGARRTATTSRAVKQSVMSPAKYVLFWISDLWCFRYLVDYLSIAIISNF
jgi:hypothetical protein